jgi:recombination protein RecA
LFRRLFTALSRALSDAVLGSPPPEPWATGFQALDAALQGGLLPGTVTSLRGEPGAGKTTLALALVAAAQRAGALVAYVDVDSALSLPWARRLGVRELVVARPSGLAEALAVVRALGSAVDVIVVDSLAALALGARDEAPQAERALAEAARAAGVAVVVIEPLGGLFGGTGVCIEVRAEHCASPTLWAGTAVLERSAPVALALHEDGVPLNPC